jgi:LPS export ABC transporter protein LptC
VKNIKSITIANIVLIFTISIVFVSCENDIETINKITTIQKMPTLVVDSLETIFSDSGMVRMKIFAPEYIKYEQPDKKYDEYPKGINVKFFNNHSEIEAVLTCRYARYFADNGLWEAKFDVVVENILSKEKLNTELLYWDMSKELIYTPKYVKITTIDGPFNGEGNESPQDFLKWRIIKPYGSIDVKDE